MKRTASESDSLQSRLGSMRTSTWKVRRLNQALGLRPHWSLYFWIRLLFYSKRPSVHTKPAVNPDTETALFWKPLSGAELLLRPRKHRTRIKKCVFKNSRISSCGHGPQCSLVNFNHFRFHLRLFTGSGHYWILMWKSFCCQNKVGMLSQWQKDVP